MGHQVGQSTPMDHPLSTTFDDYQSKVNFAPEPVEQQEGHLQKRHAQKFYIDTMKINVIQFASPHSRIPKKINMTIHGSVVYLDIPKTKKN